MSRLVTVLLVGFGVASPAAAQGVRPGPKLVYGWGTEFSPRVRLGLVQTQADKPPAPAAVEYYYETFFIGAPTFPLWTYNGQYVLTVGDEFLPLTDAGVVELLGADGAAGVRPPVAYWVPTGLAVSLVGAAGLAAAVYRSRASRAKRRLKDARYLAGLEVYTNALPPDRDPDRADQRAALAAAVEYLATEHGEDRTRADRELRVTVGEVTRAYTAEVRAAGAEAEEAGDYVTAVDCYKRAAGLMAEWDDKDAAVLGRAIERARKRLPADHSPLDPGRPAAG